MAVFVCGVASYPYRFNAAEYIQTAGAQYIDTGFKPNSNTRVVMDAQYAASNSTTAFYFGARNGYNSSAFALRLSNSNTNWMSEYANSSQTYTQTATQRLTIDFNKNTVKIGSATGSYSASTFQCNHNLVLFGLNSGGEAMDFAPALRMYSCQIYDNGNLVRDFWPCYDPNGVVCLYDKVQKRYFYNAGSGSFTAG